MLAINTNFDVRHNVMAVDILRLMNLIVGICGRESVDLHNRQPPLLRQASSETYMNVYTSHFSLRSKRKLYS